MNSSELGYQLPPFPAFPSTDRYVALGSIQDAVQRVHHSIQAKDAISIVIGPPGTGKTLICGLLSDQFQRSHQVITLGETPIADRESFLRRILHQLGTDLTNIPSGDLQLALFDHLCLNEPTDAGLLLLIDESQSLTTELLETVRTLTNLTRNGEPRVSVVLAGGNQLDELLIPPSMDGFRQRISTRCYLHPLNAEETGWYINQTIRNCGCDPDATITPDAISAVHHACSGVPRLLNQLLTHAIEYAAQHDQYLITDRIVEMAWADIQQLPSPMIDEPDINLDVSSIEFGELDELPDTNTIQPETASLDTDESELSDDLLDVDYDFNEETPSLTTKPAADPTQESSEPDVYDSYDFEPSSECCEDQQLEFGTAADTDPHAEDLASPKKNLEFPQLASPALNETCNETCNTEPSDESDSDLGPENTFSELFEGQVNTKSNEHLFGDFDDEELLNAYSEPDGTQANHQFESPPIVSVLHQEIIGVTDLLLDATTPGLEYSTEESTTSDPAFPATADLSDSDDVLPHQDDHLAHDLSSQQPGTPTESFGTASQSPAENSDKLELKVLNSDTDVDVEDENADTLRIDDSDLLIIQDEFELRRIDKPQSSSDVALPMSIDYQKLLSRMRSNG